MEMIFIDQLDNEIVKIPYHHQQFYVNGMPMLNSSKMSSKS
jgi:hypothetical protein